MPMKRTAADVAALARAARIALSEDEVAAFVEPLATLLAELDGAARRFAAGPATPPEAPVRTIDFTRPDPVADHGAFIHRFKLPPTGSGSLDGMTVGIKDTVAIAGVPLTRGRTRGWDRPAVDAPVVTRILAAGGTIVGTLNLDAWSSAATGESSEFGAIENPRAPGHLVGGSSAGSGAALAGGLVDLAIGTDTAGSARIPAAWCGLYALKPSHGLIPSQGVVGLDPSLDDVCPMARGLDECSAFFRSIADPCDPPSRSGGRVGVVSGLEATYDDEGAAAMTEALARFRGAGWTVEMLEVPLWSSAWEIESMLLATSVPHFVRTGWQGRWVEAAEPAISWDAQPTQLVALWMLAAEALGDRANDYYRLAASCRAELRRQAAYAFSAVDIILTPTTPTPPPRRSPLHAGSVLATTSGAATPVPTSTLTTPANLIGIPALAVPAGDTPEGLPRSVQLFTSLGRDNSLFSAAEELVR
jgi:amidase